MKHKKQHIIILPFLIWCFFSVFSIFFKKPERIAKRKFLGFLFCFSVAISFAQQYTNYSTKDGLPSNHIYTILQDAKGYMWFLTDKGMVKYNGKTFKTFTTKDGLPNNDIWEGFATSDGKFWYMTKATRLGYIENDSVFSFSNANKDEIFNPLHTSQIGDSIYPTGSKKTFTLKDNKWVGEVNKYSKNVFNDWVKIRHKNIGYLSFSFNDETLKLYDKNIEFLHSIKVENIYENTGARGQVTDSLFYWTNNKNYSILNFNTLEFKQFKLKQNSENDLISYPKIKLIDNTLQISGNGFVSKLNKNLEISNPFYFPKKLQALFGFIDQSNTVWLSTINNGVYKLPYSKRDVKYELQDQKIQSFNIINNSLVASVYKKGFYNYDPKEKSFQPFIENKDYVFGASEVKPLKTNFYAFKSSLYKEVNGKVKTVNISKAYGFNIFSNEIGRKIVFFNEKLYGNFSFGINRINPEPFVIEKQYSQKGCNDIISFNNQLLIATTNGLKEIKNDTLVPVVFKNTALKKSILSFTIIDATHLLINTDGFGAYITDMQSIKPLKQTEFLIVEEAFVEDTILWLATNSGVLKFAKNNNEYQLNRTFTMSDGLPTNHINTLYVNNESLIVGTNNGIAILPKQQESVSQFLDIIIEKAKYNNENITQSNKTFNYKENNNLNVIVSSIDFSENQIDFSYDYKLEPLQDKWITTTTNVVNFNNLLPGDYAFSLKSGAIKKEISFTINPLWWQKGFVQMLIIVLLITVLTYLIWSVIKKSEQKKNDKLIQEKKLSDIQLKALRSQMNPHFVFNSLAAIQYYINNNEIEASEAYLVKFSKLIRQFFELSKETEISLKEEINLLKNYLDIEKLRFKEKFEYIINIDNTIDVSHTKIPTMLIQPIVENAINHGIFNKLHNGKVEINIYAFSQNTIKVEIIDDGVGFVNTKKKSNTKVKSSNVLEDRLKYLNKSEQWEITYKEEELNPNLKDKGNSSTFIITQF